jgi:hypothetical protein
MMDDGCLTYRDGDAIVAKVRTIPSYPSPCNWIDVYNAL